MASSQPLIKKRDRRDSIKSTRWSWSELHGIQTPAGPPVQFFRQEKFFLLTIKLWTVTSHLLHSNVQIEAFFLSNENFLSNHAQRSSYFTSVTIKRTAICYLAGQFNFYLVSPQCPFTFSRTLHMSWSPTHLPYFSIGHSLLIFLQRLDHAITTGISNPYQRVPYRYFYYSILI